MKTDDNKGAIEILCKEIGFRYFERMETLEMLVAFVSVLVHEISNERWTQSELAKVAGTDAPSKDSEEVLRCVQEMLLITNREDIIAKSAEIHTFIHTVAPDGMYPCDHLIDMLSSCVSAIRFGLESPCRSRHAADAAGHVWKQLYGVSRFDSHTPNWKKDWSRAQLEKALITLAFPPVGEP